MRNFALIFAVLAGPAFAQSGNPTITTAQYNSGRTAANLNETILNTSNVNVNQFGKLFSWTVDGYIFAQPLYVPGVQIAGKTTNVVYVATMHNSLYAFDANNPGAPPLWQTSLGSSVTAPTSNGCPASTFTGPELGILSTPVIDPTTNTLYAVAATPYVGGFVHTLFALDITSGQILSSVWMQASVPGNGYDSQSGMVTLNPSNTDVQRTSLLLANGAVYAGFGNCGPDNDPWHGWVLGYTTNNLQNQVAVFNSTPNGGEGGIWQSGRGLAADSSGNIYFTTGNATPANTTTGNSTTDAQENDYPMRIIQMSSSGQFLASFPPSQYAALNANDLDFSSSGPLLIPGTTQLVAGGKDGMIYLFDQSNLSTPQQAFQATGTSACQFSDDGCDQIHDLSFWNSQLYVWGSHDVLRVYSFSNGRFNTTASAKNSVQTGYHPASIAISANSTQTGSGILWALTPDSVLHAFNAANVSTELWNTTQNASRDALPSAPRFTEPTIANGRVYAATQSKQLVVYGLLSEFSLSGPTGSQTVNQGSSTSFSISLTTLAGFMGPVSFSASGLPSGASASFNPTSLNASGSTTVTINTSSSTPTGTYSLVISGTGGGVTHTANVTLVVTIVSDTTPPQWTCCTYTPNGSTYILGFSAWDTQSGLKSIQVVQSVDATVSIPQFTMGTNNVVNFTATESGWSSYVKFQLTDVAGNVSFIDPAFLDVSRRKGGPASFTVKNVTPAEGVVTFINGTPGLHTIDVAFNDGQNAFHFPISGLTDGEVRVVDISRFLPKSGVTITITPLGDSAGTAMFIFANVPMTGSSPQAVPKKTGS